MGDQLPPWSVPREWPGERCFIIAGGDSVRKQRSKIAQLRGRIIVIKQSVVLRPDADVMFVAGEEAHSLCQDFFPLFRGAYIIARGRSHPLFPPETKRVARTKDHERLCDMPTHVAGYDSGTSAINVAYHFGATEIILLGFDMCGGRWFNGEIPHFMPKPPESHFERHMRPLPALAEDARRKGIRIVNCSPISRVECFDRQPLEAFL